MNLQDAVVLLLEEWRIKKGFSSSDMGQVLAPQDSSPEIARYTWKHIVSGDTTIDERRELSIDELCMLAAFFGVSPETVITEARIRLGTFSGSGDKSAVASHADKKLDSISISLALSARHPSMPAKHVRT